MRSIVAMNLPTHSVKRCGNPGRQYCSARSIVSGCRSPWRQAPGHPGYKYSCDKTSHTFSTQPAPGGKRLGTPSGCTGSIMTKAGGLIRCRPSAQAQGYPRRWYSSLIIAAVAAQMRYIAEALKICLPGRVRNKGQT